MQVEETLIVVSTSFDDTGPADEGQQEPRMRGRLIVYKLNCYPSPSDALTGPAQEGAALLLLSLDGTLYDGYLRDSMQVIRCRWDQRTHAGPI